ncbi:hypothetical protein SAMN06265339_0697 [Desulfurobacterium pacificum]|uniref:Uncharacterized protein n=1 Tax=Desulfurobacterium pacificum TaxID=240166 RepID=A0ABY1NGW5_9BACT|nr:hypothetical protein SAMN06265339_0697 [Desulfurobacterium pacificum]
MNTKEVLKTKSIYNREDLLKIRVFLSAILNVAKCKVPKDSVKA